MSGKIGRNEPCPCGSGRKHKVCCLRRGEDSLRRVEALRRLDRRLTERAVGFAVAELGSDWAACTAFDDTVLPRSDDVILFPPWAVYDYSYEDLPAVDWLLADHEGDLDDDEIAWLLAQRKSWLSIWEEAGAVPARGTRLRDLLTGEERVVAASPGEIPAGGALLGRVVAFRGFSLVACLHPRTLPRGALEAVLPPLRARIGTAPGRIPPRVMQDSAVAAGLIVAWSDLAEGVAAGLEDPGEVGLVLASDRYLRTGPPSDDEALVAALGGIPGIVRSLEEEPGTTGWDFPPDREGGRPGISAEFNESGLIILSSTLRGLERTRGVIEEAAGGRLRYDSRHVSRRFDLVMLAREEGAPREEEGEEEEEGEHGCGRIPWSPAEAAAFRAHKEAYYAAWPREPQPFLDGMTPLEAVEVPRSRNHLGNILEDMEEREAAVPADVRVDLAGLRRTLGIRRWDPEEE